MHLGGAPDMVTGVPSHPAIMKDAIGKPQGHHVLARQIQVNPDVYTALHVVTAQHREEGSVEVCISDRRNMLRARSMVDGLFDKTAGFLAPPKRPQSHPEICECRNGQVLAKTVSQRPVPGVVVLIERAIKVWLRVAEVTRKPVRHSDDPVSESPFR